jgi:hypothetical protein
VEENLYYRKSLPTSLIDKETLSENPVFLLVRDLAKIYIFFLRITYNARKSSGNIPGQQLGNLIHSQ